MDIGSSHTFSQWGEPNRLYNKENETPKIDFESTEEGPSPAEPSLNSSLNSPLNSPLIDSPLGEDALATLQQSVLKQMSADFDALTGFIQVSGLTELSSNAVDLVDIGSGVLSGLYTLKESNADLFSSINFSDFNLATTSVELAAGAGVELISIGRLASLIPKSIEWKNMQASIQAKEAELKAMPPTADKSALTEEIESLKREARDLAASSAFNFITSGLALTASSLNTASIVTSLASPTAIHTAELLGHAGGVAGVVGSVVGIVAGAATLYQVNKQSNDILSEFGNLKRQLKEPDIDDGVKILIDLRLRVLDKMYQDRVVMAVKGSIGLTCATIGAAGTVTTLALVAMGVGTGLTATTVTTAGVGAAAVGAGLLIGGLGYATYKNRKMIKSKLTQISQAPLMQFDKIQVQKAHTAVQKSQASMLQVEEKITELVGRKSETQDLIQLHTKIVHHLVDEITTAHSDDTKRIIKNKLKGEFKTLDGLDKEIAHIEKLLGAEGYLIEQLTHAETRDSLKLSNSNRRYTSRKMKSEMNKMEANLDSLSQRFADTTLDELQNINAILVRRLYASPESREAIKKWMGEQGCDLSTFDSSPLSSIFSYAVNHPIGNEAYEDK